MSIFQINKKMAKASFKTFNFSLPAVVTCPGAGLCAKAGYCFALLEQSRYPSARKYRERMLELSKNPLSFQFAVADELSKLVKRHGNFAVRIHASGDFYSPAYLKSWTAIATQFPEVQFYAYTKSIAMAKRLMSQGQIPANLTLIFSLGSNQDDLIDVTKDRHSRIFATYDAAEAAGYNAAASEDDSEAWTSPNHKVGLVMFGARKRKGNEALGN
jgi:hypothetical protein